MQPLWPTVIMRYISQIWVPCSNFTVVVIGHSITWSSAASHREWKRLSLLLRSMEYELNMEICSCKGEAVCCKDGESECEMGLSHLPRWVRLVDDQHLITLGIFPAGGSWEKYLPYSLAGTGWPLSKQQFLVPGLDRNCCTLDSQPISPRERRRDFSQVPWMRNSQRLAIVSAEFFFDPRLQQRQPGTRIAAFHMARTLGQGWIFSSLMKFSSFHWDSVDLVVGWNIL